MTQEHRELLLKDLSGRFPSKVFVEDENAGLCVLQSYMLNDLMFEESSDVKPYLRPMSSMTEEERNEYNETREYIYVDDDHYEWFDTLETFDWLNAHYFDYRIVPSTGKTMIESDLALEAPEGMYESK